jgi:drug/metabolite transporter (DMT)-like permease
MAVVAAPTALTAPARPVLVWAALAVVYVVWGSTYLAIRVALDTLPPFLMAATRFLIAGGLLLAFSALRGPSSRDRIGWPQWRATAIVGAALLFGGNGGVSWAEQRIASGVAALLVAVLPLWIALFDRLVFGHQHDRRTVIGLVVGFAGLALLVGPSEGGRIDPMGALVCTLASMSWAAGSLYARTAPLPHSPLVATGMQMVAGGALLLVVGLASGEARSIHLASVSRASLLAVVYLIVFGSLLAFSAYTWLLRSAPVTLVATYAYVNPVVAVLLGWAILGEPITARMLLAGSVIIGAVVLIAGAARPDVVVDAGAPVDDEPERATGS